MTTPPQSDEETASGPVVLFREADNRGRPRSETSTSSLQPQDSQNPHQISPTEVSSTAADPSWSTGPNGDGNAPGTVNDTSSPSPGNGEGDGGSGRTLTDRIASGLAGVTGAAHNTLTDDVGRDLGLYLATGDELAESADALASLAGRHLTGGRGMTRDTEDLVRLGIAVASYAGRQWRTWKQARAVRKQLAAQSAASTPAAA